MGGTGRIGWPVAIAWALLSASAAGATVGRFPSTFHPDDERNTFAAVSALALVSAAIVLLVRTRQGLVPRSALVFVLVMTWLSVDELFVVHERLEKATGVDWPVLFAPVVLATAASGLAIIRQVPGSTRWLLVVGGACWAGAVGLELLAWDGDQRVGAYPKLMVVEETVGELAGTLLFLVAAVSVGRPAQQIASAAAEPVSATVS